MTRDGSPTRPHDGARVPSADLPSGRAVLVSSLGAVLGAVLASACCWLPLALLGTGAGALGVSSFFEAYRPHLLGATGLLLAVSFYYVYVRAPRCAPGDACAVPNPRVRRLNRIGLWAATAITIAFATFPSYVGWFLGAERATHAAAPDSPRRTYAIEGMTCEACAAHLRTAIASVPGVRSAEVSFAHESATVSFEGAADDDAVFRAVEAAGYRSRRTAASGPRATPLRRTVFRE